MPCAPSLLPVILAGILTPAGWAQEASNRNLDENPFQDEKPKSARAPIPVPIAAPIKAIAPAIRPARSMEIFTGGVGRLVTFEPSEPPIPYDDDGLGDPQEPPTEPPFNLFDLKTAIVSRDNFDRWIFGEDATEKSRSDHFRELLLGKIGQALGEGQLTAEQQAKLILAGRGDIKHFLDIIEERRVEFESARKEFRAWLKFLREIEPISKTYQAGPFREGSLFAKTLAKIEKDRKQAP